MEQLSFLTLPSPCIGVCQSDAKGYCLGCFRSRDERFNWQQFSEGQKSEVIRLCHQRKRRKQYILYKAKQAQLQDQQSLINNQFDFGDEGE